MGYAIKNESPTDILQGKIEGSRYAAAGAEQGSLVDGQRIEVLLPGGADVVLMLCGLGGSGGDDQMFALLSQ